MIADFMALSPEILLLLSLPLMGVVNRYRVAKTAKTFYTVSKVFILLAAAASVIFYNQNGFPGYWQNNTYTTMLKVCVYIFALAWFFLSCKWFLNKNHPSAAYYALGICSLVSLLMMISADNLLILFIGYVGALAAHNGMIYLSDDDFDVAEVAKRCLKFIILNILMFAGGLFLIYEKAGTLSYAGIYEYFASRPVVDLSDVCCYILIFAPLLFMLGLAPFHFYFAEVLDVCVLPVSGYLTIIPVFAAYGALVNLSLNVFFPLISCIKPVLVYFAVLSLFLGAVSAIKQCNIRKLFAFSTLYHLGFIFITLSAFNYNSVSSSFIYLLIYVLGMTGIYTVFFGFKSNGEYLYNLEDIAGAFTQKPYICTALLIFIISMVGSPPMLGFLGKLDAVNNLVIEGKYGLVAVAMVTLMFLLTAYLDVIKTMFFDNRIRNFDRADKGIYICLFINILVVLITILNPGVLMDKIEKLIMPVL